MADSESTLIATDVSTDQAQQTTHAQVTMLLEAVCSTENAPPETKN